VSTNKTLWRLDKEYDLEKSKLEDYRRIRLALIAGFITVFTTERLLRHILQLEVAVILAVLALGLGISILIVTRYIHYVERRIKEKIVQRADPDRDKIALRDLLSLEGWRDLDAGDWIIILFSIFCMILAIVGMFV